MANISTCPQLGQVRVESWLMVIGHLLSCSVHNTADVTYTSPGLRVLFSTLAGALFLRRKNFCQDFALSIVLHYIRANVGFRVFKTVADELAHNFPLCWQVVLFQRS